MYRGWIRLSNMSLRLADQKGNISKFVRDLNDSRLPAASYRCNCIVMLCAALLWHGGILTAERPFQLGLMCTFQSYTIGPSAHLQSRASLATNMAAQLIATAG